MDLNSCSDSATAGNGRNSGPRQGWRSFHFYYHGDRDRMLLDLIQPLVRSLFHESRIDRFFFIRYNLDGPHIRLRLRLTTDDMKSTEALTNRITAAAENFYSSQPSTQTLSDEIIKKGNAFLSATDPTVSASEVQPDNSVSEQPFEPEVERYGGPDALGASLDFFQFSSLGALDHLTRYGHEPWGRRLARVFRFQVGLAFDLATSPEEWSEILGYAASWWDFPSAPRLLEKGKVVFAHRRSTFHQLLLTVLGEREGEASRPPWVEAGPIFRRHIDWLPAQRRRVVLQSHLHMTFNRLGIDNTNEIYLGAILLAAVKDFLASPEAFTVLPARHPAAQTWEHLMLLDYASAKLLGRRVQESAPPPP